MAATLECGRGLHLAASAPEAFAKIQRELGGVDMFIVDVDTHVHGTTILNALSFCADRIPIVVITDLEQADMEPVARSKGAVACLGKPVSQDQIREVIDRWAHRSPENTIPPEVPLFQSRGLAPGAKYGPGTRSTLTREPSAGETPA
jgi:DNA-binding NtrC family response regulator